MMNPDRIGDPSRYQMTRSTDVKDVEGITNINDAPDHINSTTRPKATNLSPIPDLALSRTLSRASLESNSTLHSRHKRKKGEMFHVGVA
jgi:hypothetical protein